MKSLMRVGGAFALGWLVIATPGISHAYSDYTVLDFTAEKDHYLSTHSFSYFLGTSSRENVYVGYTRHNGVWATWRCRQTCTSRTDGQWGCNTSGGGSWKNLTADGIYAVRVLGNGGDDYIVGVPRESVVPAGDGCKPDGSNTWRPPIGLDFIEFQGGGGNDVLISPPGFVHSALIGDTGNDVLVNYSTHWFSYADGGDGLDSLLGASGSTEGDNLFGSFDNDCLEDLSSGAQNFECGSGTDEYVAPQSGGEAPHLCNTLVSQCWSY